MVLKLFSACSIYEYLEHDLFCTRLYIKNVRSYLWINHFCLSSIKWSFLQKIWSNSICHLNPKLLHLFIYLKNLSKVNTKKSSSLKFSKHIENSGLETSFWVNSFIPNILIMKCVILKEGINLSVLLIWRRAHCTMIKKIYFCSRNPHES